LTPKLIYRARRHPSLNRTEFIRRWHQHGLLGMSLPRWRNVRRYMQCVSIQEEADALAEVKCDGVALVWYQDMAAYRRHITEDPEDRAVMKSDELQIFASPVAATAVLSEATTVKLTATVPAAKLFVFWHCADAVSRQSFMREWRERRRHPWVSSITGREGVCGYTQNVALPIAEAGQETFCVGVDEISASTVQPLRHLRAGLADQQWACAQPRWVLTESALLHGQWEHEQPVPNG
jgi:hypothetical protein